MFYYHYILFNIKKNISIDDFDYILTNSNSKSTSKNILSNNKKNFVSCLRNEIRFKRL